MASKSLCQDIKDAGNSRRTSSGFPAWRLALSGIANNSVPAVAINFDAIAIIFDAIANNFDFRHYRNGSS